MTELSRTLAALQQGTEAGWHVGYQLAVWHRGAEVVDLAAGLAKPGVALRTDTLMPWFSGTKLVTATAVMQQLDRGAIKVDQTVASVIPEFARHGKDGVTIKQLLTHTAGFRRLAPDGELFIAGNEPDALLELIYDAPLEWEPGTRAGYHPVTAFHVLGEIIHRVDGRRIEDYMSEEIFEPLGMVDSWLALPPERARAYGDRLGAMFDTSGAEPKVVSRFLKDTGVAWAEPFSSGMGPVRELVRVAEALRRGGELDGERILSTAAVAEMTRRHRVGMRDETFGAVIDWGLGVMINSWQYEHKPAPYGYGDFAGRDAFGHGGRQSSVVFADPEHELSVAFVANGMPGEGRNQRRTQPVLSALYQDLGLVPTSL